MLHEALAQYLARVAQAILRYGNAYVVMLFGSDSDCAVLFPK